MAGDPDLKVDAATDGSLRVLQLTGDLVFDSAPLLRTAIADHIHEAAVIIDLTGVSFMDSTGLAALLYARKLGAEEGWALKLRGPAPNVAALLRVTDTDTIFTIEP